METFFNIVALVVSGIGAVIFYVGETRTHWKSKAVHFGFALAIAVVVASSLALWFKKPDKPEWAWTQDDQRRLEAVLRDHPTRFPVFLIPIQSSAESNFYAEKLLTSFRAAGWPAWKPPKQYDNTLNADVIGLHVVVSANPATRNYFDARQLIQILTRAKIDHKTRDTPSTETALHFIERDTGQWGHVGIIVGKHP